MEKVIRTVTFYILSRECYTFKERTVAAPSNLTAAAVIGPNTRRINNENPDGTYTKGADCQSYIVRDGNLITGQNPASSEAVAKAVLAKR